MLAVPTQNKTEEDLILHLAYLQTPCHENCTYFSLSPCWHLQWTQSGDGNDQKVEIAHNIESTLRDAIVIIIAQALSRLGDLKPVESSRGTAKTKYNNDSREIPYGRYNDADPETDFYPAEEAKYPI